MMYYQILIGVLFISLVDADLLIDLPDGTIRGAETKTENYTYYAYRGIPFAIPPLGSLRFQAPVPNTPWDGILDATKSKDCCISMTYSENEPDQSEDCLHINVYTPPRNIAEKLPVMFWIYGGAFTTGCSSDSVSDPHALVSEDVIVVTFNYRLGLYGFLSTSDKVILGNAGLKDQLLALKWTQRNIEFFGGDPEKVTIFGESAGGMSVGAHIANKKSAGLYRAAICQSGCSLTSLAQTSQTNPKQIAYDIARSINPFISQNSEEIRDFLQSQPADVLTKAFNANPQSGPVIEVEDENAYITDLQFGLIESGNFNQVPLIIGTTSAESLMFLGIVLPELILAALAYDLNSEFLIPSNLNPLPGTDLTEAKELIKQAYTNQSFLLDLASFVEFTTDQLFVRSSLKQAELQSNYAPVYFYQFSYSGTISRFHTVIEGVGKVGHGEDVLYLLDFSPFPLTTDEEFLTRSRMTRLWTNFAKTLNPTPDVSDPLLNVTWPQVAGLNIPYLDIDTTLEVKPGKKAKEMRMWNEVFYSYGQQPFVGF
ncbi:pyrethroid hydrolase Ces2e-like [Cylas formicarius]|uniref:pyrethroid hydrolase Ces2e-like n=1 Tax=Cylas formicarius TaxID=197179 RepID=UPI002958D510|nr:pyrethroid hydrolase Ces2e-like [Cylas formicarius]